MKKLFTIVLILIFAKPLLAQVQENKEVILDFNDPKIPKVQTIKPKQTLVLKVKNLNPYLYEVTVNDTAITYANQKPDTFDGLFKMPSLDAVKASAPATADLAPAEFPHATFAAKKAKSNEKATDPDIDTFLQNYSGMEVAVRDLLKIGNIPSELDKLIFNCSFDQKTLQSKADAYIVSLLDDLTESNLPAGIETSLNSRFDAIQAALTTNIQEGEDLKKKLQDITASADKTISLAEYRTIEKSVNEKIALIDPALKNAAKLNDKLKEFKDAKVADKINDGYQKLLTSRITKSFSSTPGFSTDEITMRVTIKKKKDVFCSKEVGDFKLNALVVGGLKIDFSTGAAFNIGNKKFFDQTYRKDPYFKANNIATDSIVITRNRNNNVFVPSLGVFLNAYSRMSASLNIGGIVGASAGTDQRLYTHIGLSAIIGKSDRLIISGGISAAKANLLDGQYDEGQIIKKSDAPDTIPTVSSTRVGAFFSVTWNLNLIP